MTSFPDRLYHIENLDIFEKFKLFKIFKIYKLCERMTIDFSNSITQHQEYSLNEKLLSSLCFIQALMSSKVGISFYLSLAKMLNWSRVKVFELDTKCILSLVSKHELRLDIVQHL